MRITVAQAAAMMNVSPQFVRLGLQRGVLPIGSAVKMSSRWTYHISEHLLNEYLGIENAACAATQTATATREVLWQKGLLKDNTNGRKKQADTA